MTKEVPPEATSADEQPTDRSASTPSDARWLDRLVASTSVPLGVVSVRENRYIRANPAMAAMCGISLRELFDCDPFTLAFNMSHPDDLVEEQKLFAELASGKCDSYEIVKRYCHSDGSVRWGQLTFTGVHADDGRGSPHSHLTLEYVVVHIVDLTEQKAQAETIRRLEAELRHGQKVDGLGRLAAGIAHDFNNLLTVIAGHGEVIRSVVDDQSSGWKGPDLHADLSAILEAADRGASLTAQLLAHGRREKASPRTFLLSELVGTLKRLLVRTLGSNINIVESLTAQGAIRADQGQIGQVVMNLMLNARDAISDGGHIWLATSDVTIAPDDATGKLPPGEWVAISVGDDGHGMSLEVQSHMFEPFFTTRTDRAGTQGSGLGLATVRRIVEEANARIDVTSAPGTGTRVTVYFPRVEYLAGNDTLPPQPSERVVGEHTILVVEDDHSVRSLVAAVLVGAHYRIMVARDGNEAMRILHAPSVTIHLVVTDLMMPGLGGLGLARELRKRGVNTRVLFISGYSTHTPSEIAPFGTLLPKPFTPTQLLSAVRRALGESTPE